MGINMRQDLTSMLILILLNKKDMYGYELSNLIKKKSGSLIDLKEGTLYPSLHKLKEQGHISSYEIEVNGFARKRVYYHIEDTGRQYLSELLPDYLSLTLGIQQIIGWSKKEEGDLDSDD